MIRENASLAPCTTLGIGGPARFLVEANSEGAVLDGLELAERAGLPAFVLGGGSNLLVADRGFPGVVIRIALRGVRTGWEDGVVAGAAGEDWDALVGFSVERNWAGLECLSGIPGTVGGTPIQNVGAYGAEVGPVIRAVRVLDRADRRVATLDAAACGFSYRGSIFNTTARNRYVVLEVEYALRPGGAPRIDYPDLARRLGATRPTLAAVRAAVREIRASKAMLIVPGDPDCRSAGSFFKNPVVPIGKLIEIENAARQLGRLATGEPVPSFPAADGQTKVPAAWLIERAGFPRGYRRGRAGVSSRHTLALVNLGGATAADILALAEEIRLGVEAVFDIRLALEPELVGFEA